jgi:hypothetical protein
MRILRSIATAILVVDWLYIDVQSHDVSSNILIVKVKVQYCRKCNMYSVKRISAIDYRIVCRHFSFPL